MLSPAASREASSPFRLRDLALVGSNFHPASEGETQLTLPLVPASRPVAGSSHRSQFFPGCNHRNYLIITIEFTHLHQAKKKVVEAPQLTGQYSGTTRKLRTEFEGRFRGACETQGISMLSTKKVGSRFFRWVGYMGSNSRENPSISILRTPHLFIWRQIVEEKRGTQ
eukprot:COSAG02_NODE_4596_length_5179_cov_108.866535_2_plen_168_part_00